jgi:hypothetical protein
MEEAALSSGGSVLGQRVTINVYHRNDCIVNRTSAENSKADLRCKKTPIISS